MNFHQARKRVAPPRGGRDRWRGGDLGDGGWEVWGGGLLGTRMGGVARRGDWSAVWEVVWLGVVSIEVEGRNEGEVERME